jgi:electron transfer flavoprotein alpha subunit
LPHDTFGMDLGPGLSIKLDSAFVADVVDIEGVDGAVLKVSARNTAGMVSTHVTCDASAGAVINVRRACLPRMKQIRRRQWWTNPPMPVI